MMIDRLKLMYWKLKLPNKKVRLFLTDIDGVLTDGGMYYAENGDEFKRFHVHDGMGLIQLKQMGIKTGFVTAENRELNRRRSEKLQIDFYCPGEKDKLSRVKNICQQLNLSLEEVAFIGDDINDLELLGAVGFRACPANARPEIKKIPNILQLGLCGGSGALREWIETLKTLQKI